MFGSGEVNNGYRHGPVSDRIRTGQSGQTLHNSGKQWKEVLTMTSSDSQHIDNQDTVTADIEQGTAPETDTEQSAEQSQLFTQEDINRIIRDRINKKKAKQEAEMAEALEQLRTELTQDVEAKTAELTTRENRLVCHQFLLDNELPIDLLEIIDTNEPDSFMEKAKKAAGLIEEKRSNRFIPPLKSTERPIHDHTAQAFSDTAHKPRNISRGF